MEVASRVSLSPDETAGTLRCSFVPRGCGSRPHLEALLDAVTGRQRCGIGSRRQAYARTNSATNRDTGGSPGSTSSVRCASRTPGTMNSSSSARVSGHGICPSGSPVPRLRATTSSLPPVASIRPIDAAQAARASPVRTCTVRARSVDLALQAISICEIRASASSQPLGLWPWTPSRPVPSEPCQQPWTPSRPVPSEPWQQPWTQPS